MDIDAIRAPIADDFAAVDSLIVARLHSEVALVNQLGYYIINAGGKRLRPLLVLLAARALGYQGKEHITLAAVVEFIHTATLLHDDVVDASTLRRGRETANALFGNEASVLVGDFLYSRAFQMMTGVGSMRVMTILSDATNIIAEGEVMQLMNCRDPDTSEARYLEVIRCKTAKLFEAAAELGAVLAEATPAQVNAMVAYGLHLGNAFQLIDDALDYNSSSAELGKNIGDDLAEGKPTLPLIHAQKHGTAEEIHAIRTAIEQGGLEQLELIQKAIARTGAIEYTARLADLEAEKALAALQEIPASPYRDAMETLAKFAVVRKF